MGVEMFLLRHSADTGASTPKLKYPFSPGTIRTYEEPDLVACWWKASQILACFLQSGHVGGVLSDGIPTIPRDGLRELSDIVERVMANPTLAPKLLPWMDGVFFGPRDYDDS